jgi:hypothetical protein
MMRIPSKAGTGSVGGMGGTIGGKPSMAAGRVKAGGKQVMLGDEVYLWILVLLEVGAMAWARQSFRRHHGG